jgi:hypothetical protein
MARDTGGLVEDPTFFSPGKCFARAAGFDLPILAEGPWLLP